MAGFALLGGGSVLLNKEAVAQTATSFQCDGPVTVKPVTSLKPSAATGGFYKDLKWGKLEGGAADFGRYADITVKGTLGKLAKGVSIAPSAKQTQINLRYFAKQTAGEHTLAIAMELQTLAVGDMMDYNHDSAKVVVTALNGPDARSFMGTSEISNAVEPSASAYYAAPAGTLKSKLPKSSDFTAKVMIAGKVIAEAKFPKLELAKIIDALDKEYAAQAKKIVDNATLKGDLSTAVLPAGCKVTKPAPSSGGHCFLTTAAVRAMGLTDDSWELTSLHAFGKRYVRTSTRTKRLMTEYYLKGPAVVDRINERADAASIWLKFYWQFVVPSALASQLRLDGIAGRIYVRGSRKLQQIAAA